MNCQALLATKKDAISAHLLLQVAITSGVTGLANPVTPCQQAENCWIK